MTERELLKDEVYFDAASSLSRLSKDRNTKIGAVIVASDGTPVSWGSQLLNKNYVYERKYAFTHREIY